MGELLLDGLELSLQFKVLVVGLWLKTICGYSRYEYDSRSRRDSQGYMRAAASLGWACMGVRKGSVRMFGAIQKKRLCLGPLLAHW